jgi:hypothetical protein
MDHIPSKIIPLPCPLYDAPTRRPPPVAAFVDVGFPVTGTQPLLPPHTTFVVKAETDDPTTQLGGASGLTIRPDNTPAVPCPPPQPPPHQKLLV